MHVMKKPEVDPAALLIAIIAVAVTPLTTSGPWDKLNTAVALIVLIVLWAYTIGSHRRDSLESFIEFYAISLVMGLIFAISIAWPIQFFWTWTGKTNDEPDFVAADYSTWSGLALGLVIATVLAIFLWKKSASAKAADLRWFLTSIALLTLLRRPPSKTYHQERQTAGPGESSLPACSTLQHGPAALIELLWAAQALTIPEPCASFRGVGY